MQSKLEAVLKDKERELKLYQKFEGLVAFCEGSVFPFASSPLQRHIEELKEFVERLLPEPTDRREEMFSGEIFVLLCTLYLHDLGVAGRYDWSANRDLLDQMEAPARRLFFNNEIGMRLGIPEKALELVNSLIFSIKKTPLEWEIREDTRKAIVRNGRALGEIFNFAHLMWDVFSADAIYTPLRRGQDRDLRLRCEKASVDIDSREGIIFIRCTPEMPYQEHVMLRVKPYVEFIFRRFREMVNGRLGFQYRQIVWDTGGSSGVSSVRANASAPSTFEIPQGRSFDGWEEASRLLDKLFRYGHVLVVGDGTSGKSSLVDSFVMPQLRRMSPNVFHAEVWDRPMNQIREALERVASIPPGRAVDIVSMCKELLPRGRCFLVIDGCERLKSVGEDELDKLERLVEFCIGNEAMYLIVIGDKAEFFDWYRPFRRTSLRAVYEPGRAPAIDARKPISEDQADGASKAGVDEVVRAALERESLVDVVGVLAGETDGMLKRHGKEEILADACIPEEEFDRILEFLEENKVARRHEVGGELFYALTGRYVRDLLKGRIDLSRSLDKRAIRRVLADAIREGRLLAAEELDLIERLRERMVFSKAEAGLIIASAVPLKRDCTAFIEKAKQQSGSFDGAALLQLLTAEDVCTREQAIRLLPHVSDEGIINPILAHLPKERAPELRGLLADHIVAAGKRRAVVALMKILSEIGDRATKERVIERIYELPEILARDLLIRIADVEKEPEVIDRIDGLLVKLES